MYAPWDSQAAAELISAHLDRQGALLPILHDLQERFGHVPAEAVPMVAEALNLSRADVHGVVSFYPDFRSAPPGRLHVKLCQAEACQARGARDLTAFAEQRLGVRMGQTTADRGVTLEAVYCLGLCASGPAALVDERLVARLTPASFDAMCGEHGA